MKGFISRAVLTACLTAGLAAAGGCCCGYYDVVDPCYPMRYSYAARKEVCEARYQQVHNGHVLDQTIWNWMFKHEEGGKPTAELNGAGMDHLMYIVRRRPCADATIYLATAQDIAYDAADAEGPTKFANARAELDAKRQEAIMRYVNAQAAGRNMAPFTVCVHDPAESDMAATAMAISIAAHNASFVGALPLTSGGGAGGAPGR
jgi:hypothetical protein